VQALLASGCRVAVLDHDSDALAQLAATHPDAQRLLPIRADVSSPTAVEAAFQNLQQHWGAGPSVLVNNAAITSAAPLAELDPALWERCRSTWAAICAWARPSTAIPTPAYRAPLSTSPPSPPRTPNR
jgi:NAD(P)-dependent dehydrogenase (short-subunit alcohol dehydrogenase family)